MKRSIKLLAVASSCFVLLSCSEHPLDEALEVLEDFLGTGSLLAENPDKIQRDIKSFSDVSSFKPSVSLESKFPPIQSQGQYGTCTAWSTGYAFKTALNAIDKNWSSGDLENPQNQTSPKDLWQIVPSDKKGNNCNGVAFVNAMDALISKGAKSLAEAPYEMEGQCGTTSNGNPENKLANYRKIAQNYVIYDEVTYKNSKKEGMDLDNFKGYLAQGRPVLITGKLGNRFDRWKGDAVINVDYHGGRYLSKWGIHAMVLVGYDDSKGENGAFRVRNSWGTDWGDEGSIWVDYNYFLEGFCVEAYVAQNPNSPPDETPNPPKQDSKDLLARFAEDYHDTEDKTGNLRKRVFSYEVYNNGPTEILASENWGVYYLYYNAYNADEYGIIFEDHYTDESGEPCTKPEDFDNKVCWGKYDTDAPAGGIWNNMNVKPGKIAGEEEAGGYGFEIPYEMPSITGDYYLVIYADYRDVIKESNENNNFYFITAPNGKPLEFRDGVMQSTPVNSAASAVLGKRAKAAPVHSVVDLGELNGYTPQEIKTLLNRDKKNGVLAKKIAQYRENSTHPVKRRR